MNALLNQNKILNWNKLREFGTRLLKQSMQPSALGVCSTHCVRCTPCQHPAKRKQQKKES